MKMSDFVVINSVIDLPGEEWKNITNYPTMKVSNYGRIISYSIVRKNIQFVRLKSVRLTGDANYLSVNLDDKQQLTKAIKIHRLVATHFIPNPNNLPEVNHINGNRYDNRVENLEWISGSDNINHSKELKLGKINLNTVPILQLTLDGEIVNRFISITSAAKTLNYRREGIANVVYGRALTYKGFNWEKDLATSSIPTHQLTPHKWILPSPQIENLDGEIWKNIRSYKNYEISSLGRVRYRDAHIGWQYLGPRKRITIYGQEYSLIQLVGETFIPNPENRPYVVFKTNNYNDFSANNLKWIGTHNKIKWSGISYNTGGTPSIKITQLTMNGEILNHYPSIGFASKTLNIDKKSIRGVLQGKRKTAGGYVWKFDE